MRLIVSAIMTLFILVLSGLGFCEEGKTRIIVFDMESKSKELSGDEVITLSDYIRATFINTGVFDVVSREQLNKIMQEYKFQTAGMTEESNIVRLGKILNVNNAVMGTIGKFGDIYIINIKMLNLETGKYLSAESIKAKDKNECLTSIEEKVGLISKTIPNADAASTIETGENQKPAIRTSITTRSSNLCPDGDFKRKELETFDMYEVAEPIDGKWHLIYDAWKNEHSDLSGTVEDNGIRIKINHGSGQLDMRPIKIEEGKHYRVSLDAVSSIYYDLNISIRYGGEKFIISNIKNGSQKFIISPKKRKCSLTFTGKQTDENGMLAIYFGGSKCEFWISDVRFEEISD